MALEHLDTSAGSEIWKKRHTAAHVLAQAVLQMFPDARLAIGPPIEDGFYYDFELPRSLTPARHGGNRVADEEDTQA